MTRAMKSISMISAPGRCPPSAAPMAAPAIACSEIGVARTRWVPYLVDRPWVRRTTPPGGSAMSSPSRNTRGSLPRAMSKASLIASPNVISRSVWVVVVMVTASNSTGRVDAGCEHIRVELVSGQHVTAYGERQCLLHLVGDLLGHRLELVPTEKPLRDQPLAELRHRIVGAGLFDRSLVHVVAGVS